MAMLFLGLIFDIILLLFTVLSVLLFYSLLMISVETKTFEFGVMRMVGLSKTGIINVVFIQAFMYVLPSIILAFVTSVPALFFLYKIIFTGDSIEHQSPMPSDLAIAQGLLVGILIPILSAILPIKVALSKDLNESLDTSRSKTKANMIEVLDPNNASQVTYILFGALTTTYGTCVYYFLPLALISFNWAMILKIFFGILIGLLLGLTLLAFNVQRLLEICLSHIILFCDLKCFGNLQLRGIKKMVMMNLEAHRIRN